MQQRSPFGARQSGLSLIELMVALTLGIIIVAALSQLYVNISKNNEEMAKTNSQIENARFGMQFLREEIVHAGFWATHVPEFDDLSLTPTDVVTDVPTEAPDPCLAYSTPWSDEHKRNLIGIGIDVRNNTLGSCAAPVLEDKVAGTDILVVRHANTCEPGVGNCDDTGIPSGQLYFQPDLFDPPQYPPYVLDPNSPLKDKEGDAGMAPRRKFVQTIFYVREWSSDDPVKDGIPTLVRATFELNGGVLAQQAAVPLVEGIEDFRVELGIDSVSEPYPGFPNGSPADPNQPIDWFDEDNWDIATNRGDGIPDGNFVYCGGGCGVYQLMNTVAVRVYLLSRANQETQGYTDSKTYTLGGGSAGPFNDGFKRHVFSTTVRLNNVAARRETP
jgi:type IV pilus assembly protein PilW